MQMVCIGLEVCYTNGWLMIITQIDDTAYAFFLNILKYIMYCMFSFCNMNSFIAVREDEYFMAGKMIAVSVVHGGPGPHFLSEDLVHYLAGQPSFKSTVNLITDSRLSETCGCCGRKERNRGRLPPVVYYRPQLICN